MKTSLWWLLAGVIVGVLFASVVGAAYLQDRASHELRIELR
jgi:Tfp pilus assembly protein PilN